MRANFFLSIVAAAGALMLNNASLAERAPEIPTKPVSTEYHGVTVEDPYQWLENDDAATGQSVVGCAKPANTQISRQLTGSGGD